MYGKSLNQKGFVDMHYVVKEAFFDLLIPAILIVALAVIFFQGGL